MGTFFRRRLSFKTCNPARKLFDAFALNYATVIPNAASFIIPSIVNVNNTHGSGSIDQINFAPGHKYTFVRMEVKIVDELNFIFKFDIIDGDATKNTFTKIDVEMKMWDWVDEKSNLEVDIIFYAYKWNWATLIAVEEAVKNVEVLFKAVDAYLLHNPYVPI